MQKGFPPETLWIARNPFHEPDHGSSWTSHAEKFFQDTDHLVQGHGGHHLLLKNCTEVRHWEPGLNWPSPQTTQFPSLAKDSLEQTRGPGAASVPDTRRPGLKPRGSTAL